MIILRSHFTPTERLRAHRVMLGLDRRPASACWWVRSTYEALSRLPPQRVAPVLRALLSGRVPLSAVAV
jgi:hypothetical protein